METEKSKHRPLDPPFFEGPMNNNEPMNHPMDNPKQSLTTGGDIKQQKAPIFLIIRMTH